MCGLVGFINFSNQTTDDKLQSMVMQLADTLRHRGPDNHGMWVNAEGGIALGHRRLSIIDLSCEGLQPMISESGRYVIIYNGEVYNFRELRKELLARGHIFRSHSDTEVMLAAFEEWGIIRKGM